MPVPRRKKALHELAGSGDDGTTGLLGGGRAPKDDPRIEAYGTVDEASSALGLAKALTTNERVRNLTERLQGDLYRVGAELATNPEQSGRFVTMTPADVAGLESLMAELEAEAPMPSGFILPGSTPDELHVAVSQWNTATNWPYRAMHFRARVLQSV